MKQLPIILFLFMFVCTSVGAQTAHTGMRDLTGLEITADMAPGLNLYNTLDACGNSQQGLNSETYWGQPYTTKAMITSMASKGFKTLRIPVTWWNHMGPAPTYTIDKEWMDRVEEVANYAFDNNMYVIINIHHDDLKSNRNGTWLTTTYALQDNVEEQLEIVWSQIATRFKDYGDYLLFETLNEPREAESDHEWNGGTAENRDVVNQLNVVAVNAIRNSGGNNAKRFILVPQCGAHFATAVSYLLIPNDDPNVIVSVHNYNPRNFVSTTPGTDEWGTDIERAAMITEFDALADRFTRKGQAVIVGEWGAVIKDNYADVVDYSDAFSTVCRDRNVCPIAWRFPLDRKTMKWTYPMVTDAMLRPFSEENVRVDDLLLNIPDTVYVGDNVQLTASVLPEGAISDDEVIWESDNDILASLSEKGILIPKREGIITIKATTIGQVVEQAVQVLDTGIHLFFHVEAEDFNGQDGVQLENCQDEGGGQDVAYINNNDWCEYRLVIDSTGIYDFIVRVATANDGGVIEVYIDNKLQKEIVVDGNQSNGWQDWYTVSAVELELRKGIRDIKLVFKGGNTSLFNINWFQVNFNRLAGSPAAIKDIKKDLDIQVYPIPVDNILHIVSAYNIERIELHNVQGQVVYRSFTEGDRQILKLDFLQGIYYLTTYGECKTNTKKIVVR